MYYDEEGERHLEYKHKEELIEIINMDDNPRLLLRHACTIPGCALAVLNVQSTIKKVHEVEFMMCKLIKILLRNTLIWL